MNYMLSYAQYITRASDKLLMRQIEITSLLTQASQRLRLIKTSKLPYTRTVVIICMGLEIYAFIVKAIMKAVIFVYQSTLLPLICKIAICYLLTYINGMATRRLKTKAQKLCELAL